MRTEAPSALAGDWLTDHGLCRICALPLPHNADSSGICSRRCASRRALSVEVIQRRDELTAAILAEIRALKAGTTICPGELSHRVLPGHDLPLGVLRPLLFALAEAGKIRLSQKGAVVLWRKIRGPFRVGR